MSDDASQEEKQNYLRENILDKGYDANVFLQFLIDKRGEDAADVGNWTMNDLQLVVKEFIKLNGGEVEEEKKPPKKISMFDVIPEGKTKNEPVKQNEPVKPKPKQENKQPPQQPPQQQPKQNPKTNNKVKYNKPEEKKPQTKPNSAQNKANNNTNTANNNANNNANSNINTNANKVNKVKIEVSLCLWHLQVLKVNMGLLRQIQKNVNQQIKPN